MTSASEVPFGDDRPTEGLQLPFGARTNPVPGRHYVALVDAPAEVAEAVLSELTSAGLAAAVSGPGPAQAGPVTVWVEVRARALAEDVVRPVLRAHVGRPGTAVTGQAD